MKFLLYITVIFFLFSCASPGGGGGSSSTSSLSTLNPTTASLITLSSAYANSLVASISNSLGNSSSGRFQRTVTNNRTVERVSDSKIEELVEEIKKSIQDNSSYSLDNSSDLYLLMGIITEGFLEGINTIGLSETEKIYIMNKMGESTSKVLGDFKDNASRSDNHSVTSILDNTTFSFSSMIDSSGLGTSSYGEGNSGYMVGLMNNLAHSLDNQSVDESLKNNIKLSLVGLSKIDKTGFDNSEYETASKKNGSGYSKEYKNS